MARASSDLEPPTTPTLSEVDASYKWSRWTWSWFSFAIGAGFSALISVVLAPIIQPAPRRLEVSSESAINGVSAQPLGEPGISEPSSMHDVLRLAEDTLAYMRNNLDDYTATMVKQETVDGVLTEPTEMFLKVHCPHRGGKADESQPMRVYLRFDRPDNVAGREVIWAKDLHDGKLVVHEAGLMGLVTVRLDPQGMIAMRGQRYPIWEIGLTKLVQKLIERGEADRNNPNVSVTITHGIKVDNQNCDLVVVSRKQPSGAANDFSRAEICFDTQRRLPLRYSAYGWGKESAKAPLIESYTYTNVKTNVGLTEADFDPANPSYKYP